MTPRYLSTCVQVATSDPAELSAYWTPEIQPYHIELPDKGSFGVQVAHTKVGAIMLLFIEASGSARSEYTVGCNCVRCLVVESGSISIQVNGHAHALSPGQAVLAFPADEVACAWDNVEAFVVHLYLSGARTGRLRERRWSQWRKIPRAVPQDAADTVHALARCLAQEVDRRGGRIEGLTYLVDLAHAIEDAIGESCLDLALGGVAPADPIWSADLSAAQNYIDNHLTADLTPSRVAQAVGIGLRTLQMVFLHGAGLSPTQYIRRRRLETARSLLRAAKADATVRSVARSVGYTHLGRFSAHYRTEFRELPSDTLARSLRSSG